MGIISKQLVIVFSQLALRLILSWQQTNKPSFNIFVIINWARTENIVTSLYLLIYTQHFYHMPNKIIGVFRVNITKGNIHYKLCKPLLNRSI